MLNNLWLVHAHEKRYDLAALAVEKILLCEPDQSTHLRDLGYLWAAAGETHRGIAALQQYLDRTPHAPDAPAVSHHLTAIRNGEK